MLYYLNDNKNGDHIMGWGFGVSFFFASLLFFWMCDSMHVINSNI